jgi:hypothetical protein
MNTVTIQNTGNLVSVTTSGIQAVTEAAASVNVTSSDWRQQRRADRK